MEQALTTKPPLEPSGTMTTFLTISANLGAMTGGNITLSATGFIRGGAATFSEGKGFWEGYEGDQYKWRVGDPTASMVQWDGDKLTITGPDGSLVLQTGGHLNATYIANAAIDNAKIGDLAVSTGKINDLAVTNAKIQNATITSAKFANGALGNFWLFGNSGSFTLDVPSRVVFHYSPLRSVGTLTSVRLQLDGVAVGNVFTNCNGFYAANLGAGQHHVTFSLYDNTGSLAILVLSFPL
ncbi:MAG: hypothetical protein LBU45_04175 [Azoarcus sp.]|jgi:hypothetical protein|nr:hypothetical protein [Azoarcus sp.]